MKKLVIEFSNERLITPSGLSLVGQMLGKSNFIKKCNNMKVDGKRSQSQIKNGDILLSYIGLLCQGKTSFAFGVILPDSSTSSLWSLISNLTDLSAIFSTSSMLISPLFTKSADMIA